MNESAIKNSLLAILFVAGDAVPFSELAVSLDIPVKSLMSIANDTICELEREESGILLKKIDNKLQLCSNPAYMPYIDKALAPIRKSRLSQSLLETLSIIAYKQPITRIEIEQVRGVACNYSLSMLLERGLIVRKGRKKTLGNPLLYVTNDEFLRHFGIESLKDLPSLKLNE
ncbi:MAG: SMC-Scp complex subunit ScpB [Clostridia bacterium]|jgi:segregation and condensation protein B|nr:SMC-Scp complex subunit ScpB [Clostridia bacterium]MBT7122566.1 SMC-Scp complex subunit ScpB [Clostridia bacterium]